MKKATILLGFCLLLLKAGAQFQKGRVIFGPDFGFDNNDRIAYAGNMNFQKIRSAGYGGHIGVFVKENMLVKATYLFNPEHLVYGSGLPGSPELSDIRLSNFLDLTFTKYYPLAKKIFVSASLSFYYDRFLTHKYLGTELTNVLMDRRFSISIYPSLSYTLSKRIFVEMNFTPLLSANYIITNVKDGEYKIQETGKTLSIHFTDLTNFNLGFGFNITIGK
jgi:hypothetical protein